MAIDPVSLTRELIRYRTINPPGDEQACIEHLGRLLAASGFDCRTSDLAAGRPNLIARLPGRLTDTPPLAFTGHVDVVPLGSRPWTFDPFAGEVATGRVLGRGASDMKSGVAALVAAATSRASAAAAGAGVVLIITVGEETGCDGAFHLARNGRDLLGHAGALVVAEPTSNRPLVGHRGALWLKARSEGKTAHGSMPHEGINAVYKAARAISRLEDFDFNVARHPVLGGPSLNVGWVHGGINVNSVPDVAEVGIDIRSIPGQSHARLMEELARYLGEDVRISATIDVPGVWTEPTVPFMRTAFATVAAVQGAEPAVEAAPYFTDASALTPALGDVPTVILGPGPAHIAHQTDEWCEVAKIEEATEIYARLIDQWCAA